MSELVEGLRWLVLLVPEILGLVKAKRAGDAQAALEAQLALVRKVEDQLALEEIAGS